MDSENNQKNDFPQQPNGVLKKNFDEEFREVKEIFAHNLKAYRKSQKISQKRLSEVSGVAKITIKNIETSKENVTIKTILKLAIALDKFYYNFLKEKVDKDLLR